MSQDSDFTHLPVLFDECMQMLRIRPDGIYVDCTAGGGGHSAGILDQLGPGGQLISMDKDDQALAACEKLKEAKKSPANWKLIKSDFSSLAQILDEEGIESVDGILADLGVSSHQLDTADRGFSYSCDGPLDMRMDDKQKLTAEIVVNRYTEDEIVRILRNFGEERYAGRIAAAIVRERKIHTIRTTTELSKIISKAMPAKSKNEDQHPSRRSFQAIRIEVNHELSSIEKLLEDAPSYLRPGGRIAIISFHSLEDRMVKEAFRKWEDPCVCPREFPVCVCNRKPIGRSVSRKAIEAKAEETVRNKRSKSAKLRVFERNTLE
jgi:16S rRNA (cytosine1402-N4)-methyltransferase